MDWVAEKAALTLEQMGRLTVVVQDNGSIHTRQLVGSVLEVLFGLKWIVQRQLD